MRKNLIVALAVIACLAISMNACRLGEDIDTLKINASKTVNIADIKGITAPSIGGTPVTKITENEQYSGTITWSPELEESETFTSVTQYTATITLTEKTGYTVHKVKADFFKVAGAKSVSNSSGSGVITAVFPQTPPITTIEYSWDDEHDSLVTTSGGRTSILTGSTLNISPSASASAQSTGYTVKKWFVNGVDTGQFGNSYTFSTTTIGKHTVDLFLEKGGKLYSTSITIEVLTNVLTANTWANGNITSSTGDTFKFVATSSTQYIHINFGTFTDWQGVNIQLLNSSGYSVGYTQEIYNESDYDKYASFSSLLSGQTYYIKVTPNGYGNTGTYQIAFNTSTTPPLPSNSDSFPTLTANIWTGGRIISSAGEQWFKFTATASTQYIHVNFGTLSGSYGFYVQLYNSTGSTNGSYVRYRNGATYNQFYLTNGQTYYIKVMPFSSDTYSIGTYQITFNTSSTPPALPAPEKPPSAAIYLTSNVWKDSSITGPAGEQWFCFDATSYTHYIHVNFVTLTSSNGLYVQLYEADGTSVGSEAFLYSSTTYTSRSSLTSGKKYYIKVMVFNSTGGTYKIAFNTSSAAPGTTGGSGSEANPISLTNGVWTNGSITSTASNSAVWYSFSVTSGTTYREVTGNTGTFAVAYSTSSSRPY